MAEVPFSGPGLEKLRGLAGGQEGYCGTADAGGQFFQARGLKDTDALIQMAAGGTQERFGAGGQEKAVLVRCFEAGLRSQGLIGCEEEGIGRGELRRNKRDQRATVVQGNQHAALPGLGQVGHQRRIFRRKEGLENADGIRQDALRLRAAVETEHRSRVGRDSPQERVFGIGRCLPGLVLPVEAAHRPRDARQHQRNGDDRYDSAFPVHF